MAASAVSIHPRTLEFVQKHGLQDGQPKLIKMGDCVTGHIVRDEKGRVFLGHERYEISAPGDAGYVLDNAQSAESGNCDMLKWIRHIAWAWRWVRFDAPTGLLFSQSFGTRCDLTRHRTGFLNAWFPFVGVSETGYRIFNKSTPFAAWKKPILGKFMECDKVLGWAMNFDDETEMKAALRLGWRDLKLEGASDEDVQTFNTCILMLATHYQLHIM